MTAKIIPLKQHQEDETEIKAVGAILAEFDACLSEQDKIEIQALQAGDLEVQEAILKD